MADTDEVLSADEQAKAVSDEQAKIAQELEQNPRDETIPGGRILRDGVLVNAYGKEITKDGKLKNPEDAYDMKV